MFNFFKKAVRPNDGQVWRRTWDKSGICVEMTSVEGPGAHIDMSGAQGFLAQLVDDQLAMEAEDGVFISWDELYAAMARAEYAGLAEVLALPSYTSTTVGLRSNRALSDIDFSIAIAGWRYPSGSAFSGELLGPLLIGTSSVELMRPEQWTLFDAVVSFSRRPDSERDELSHRRAWGRIRQLARAAGAQLDDFLVRSVVLTPETLDIQLRRSDVVADDRVIEVIPGFDEAPPKWLDAFDRRADVPERYDVVSPEGIVQVLVTDKVRTVLQEIKRMEGRRVAGTRAQAFITNPFATLGPDANAVVNERQFEQARDAAGLHYERFVPVFERDGGGVARRVGLLIESADSRGLAESETEWLDKASLENFIQRLTVAVERGYQLLSWKGYEFEVQGDAERILGELRAAADTCFVEQLLVTHAQVYDLSGYSARIEGIGLERAYASPHIAKKDESEGWFPDNLMPVVVVQPKDGGEPVVVSTTKPAIEQLKKDVEKAVAAGDSEVDVRWLDQKIAVDEARNIVETFSRMFDEVSSGGGPITPPTQGGKGQGPGQAKQLILRANIEKVDYEELRRDALTADPQFPTIPSAIKPGLSLLPHQIEGLAWMQHLYKLQNEYQVRGAILADDMGLGKTFQLLSLMAWLLEVTPNIEPMLVVAPVALLENWAEEAKKFFNPGTLPILTAYGSGLDGLRVPRSQIDQRLQAEDRLTKFLIPDWVGDAKVVLTTYETLRDLEFSFAAQRWSLMVCDEAQKIKNPAAMMTRAAKKQNVSFKIACTGTPVENTLADLWCLFDFVQPGLLGALNDFCDRYRRPIEAKTDEELARVDELRARISPQILRRLKSEVATDLPPKIIVEDCRHLPLSPLQRNLYAKSVESFKKRNEPGQVGPFKNHLGLLHYLRLVCTDPRPHGMSVFKPEAIDDYCAKAPKLSWLLETLESIKGKGEKAIVFCEFREIQRLLQHYISSKFGYKPDIINGDTVASATHTASRQKRIKAFQDRPGFGVIILSPVAVGFGVNIQEANHVVHYTRTWNPAKEEQATDRAYRIGQKRPVYVYHPVVCAEDFMTFDVKLDMLLASKRKLAGDMLNGAGDVMPGDFNLSDVVPGGQVGGFDERVSLDIALRMDWQMFECLAAALWAKQGYECYRTPGAKDYGVDVVARAGDTGQLIQAKSSGVDGHKFSWDAVKEVVAGEAYYRKRHARVQFEKICITNQYFNRHATENAELNGVRLLDQGDLGDLLERHDVTMLEVERMLHTGWHVGEGAA
jgi:hypothetical protein